MKRLTGTVFASSIVLALMVELTAPASAQEPWAPLAANAATNTNVVYSPILESELNAALNDAPFTQSVIANCNEPGLPTSTRVFVADLYVPKTFAAKGAGNSCVAIPGNRNFVVGSAAFNSTWWPQVGPISPAAFYGKTATYRVPTIHLSGIGRVEHLGGTEVIEVNFRDLRYAMLLFPGNPATPKVRAATQSLLSQPDPDFANLPAKVDVLKLAMPQFKVETRLRRNTRTSSMRFVETATLLDVHSTGLGKPPAWPAMPRHGFRTTGRSLSVTLNRPFYFAIVRFDTRSVLFVGYLARPTLNT